MIHTVHWRVWWATSMGSKGQEKERLVHRMRGSGKVKKDKEVRKTIPSFKQTRLRGLSWPCTKTWFHPCSCPPWTNSASPSGYMVHLGKLFIFQGEKLLVFLISEMLLETNSSPPCTPLFPLHFCRVRGCSYLQVAPERGSEVCV